MAGDSMEGFGAALKLAVRSRALGALAGGIAADAGAGNAESEELADLIWIGRGTISEKEEEDDVTDAGAVWWVGAGGASVTTVCEISATAASCVDETTGTAVVLLDRNCCEGVGNAEEDEEAD